MDFWTRYVLNQMLFLSRALVKNPEKYEKFSDVLVEIANGIQAAYPEKFK